MRARFNKSNASGVSFFAFQDVITGTTGFLIIITIFLALNLDEVIVTSQDVDISTTQAAALTQTLEQIVILKRQVAGVPVPGEDKSTIIRMIEELKRSIDRLAPSKEQPSPSSSPEESMLSREISFEKQKLLTKLESLQKLLPETTKEAAAAESRVASLESEIKDAQNHLQQTIDRENVLHLIPERSATSKDPILVVVKKNSLSFQLFDGSDPKLLISLPDLIETLQSYPTTSYYLVLYFKPSGAPKFDDLTEGVRKVGYEIGYDLIPESVELETAKPKK